MAVASASTTAPARPLSPLPTLDRRAIGRDGWARARKLAARFGGAVSDHVAEGMRQAWAVARGLLRAAASAPAASDASALASESASAASASDNPAQSRSVDQVGTSDLVPIYPATSGAVPSLLPLPAPLPSLTAALSRRRAVFGIHDGVDA